LHRVSLTVAEVIALPGYSTVNMIGVLAFAAEVVVVLTGLETVTERGLSARTEGDAATNVSTDRTNKPTTRADRICLRIRDGPEGQG